MKQYSIMLRTILVFIFLYSCERMKQKKYTPKEFLNNTVVKKDDYTKDSVELIKQLKTLLVKHEDFFYSKAYFDSTQLIIDSIIYSPDLKKLAAFVIFTNSSDLQSISNDIREACFRTFVTKDTFGAYAYNMNDIRFWDSPIRKKIEYEKAKWREFEEEKRKHPENVYEPKK